MEFRDWQNFKNKSVYSILANLNSEGMVLENHCFSLADFSEILGFH